MKHKSTLIVLTFFLITACKKEKQNLQSNPVYFTSTFYENACTWDASGKPDCLLSRDSISAELLNYVNNTLPEGKDLRKTNPSLLSTSADGDIVITQPSDVYITFVQQTTSLSNSFAYYSFPTNQPPQSAADVKKMTYFFPNVKSPVPLQPGDKVKLGRFDAGTSIGLALLQGAWSASAQKPDNNAVHFCSNDILNPEVDPKLKKHAVFLNFTPENKILIGFDDANRTATYCDHDFNDVVLYATITH